MLEARRGTEGIQAVRIGRMVVALLIAISSSGCATLMQPFSAVQPTGALVEPEANSGPNASDADPPTASVEGQWITRVYLGWAGPSSQM